MGVLKKLFDIRQDELPRFSLLFAAFFVFNMGIAWASPSTRGVVVAEFGADFIKYGFVWYGIVTIVVSIIYTAFVDRLPKHFLLVAMTVISAALVGISVFIVFVPSLRAYGALALFVLYKVIVLVWVLQWKTALLDFYDTRTSKRVLPLLGTSRLLGITVGSVIFSLAVNRMGIGAESFFMYWMITIVFVALILWALPRIMRDPQADWPEASEGYLASIREGFAYIGKSKYLKWMMISAILMNAQIALFEISSTVLANDYFNSDADAVGAFFANIDAVFSFLLLLVQLFIFPRMMKAFGVGVMNLIYPITSFGVAGAIVLATTGVFGRLFTQITAAAAYIDIEAFRRVFRTPINGLLVNAVPSFMKGRSRSVINGVISPFANVFIGLAVLINTIPLPGGREISSEAIFIVLAVVISAAYMYTGFVLRREYGQAMVKLLEREDYAALLSQEYEWGAVDTSTLEQLQRRLQETDDVDLIHFFATIMLEAGGTDAVSLLIDHARSADDVTKQVIMDVLHENDVRSEMLRSFYVENSNHEVAKIRRAALIGLMNVVSSAEEIRFQIASDHAHDADPVVRAEAAHILLQSGTIAHRDTADRVLKAMQTDADTEARLAAVQAMVDMGDVEYIRHLVRFMEDDDDDVRLAATVAIDKLWREEMPHNIIHLILDREKMLLDDPIEQVRQAELRVLGKIWNSNSASTLIRALIDTSPAIRHAAMDALVELKQYALQPLQLAIESDNRDLARQALMTLARINRERYDETLVRTILETLDDIYANHAILHVLDDCKMYPSFGVLAVHFQEQNRHLLGDVFEMLCTIYDPMAVRTIRETLQSENARTRINAVEALESLTTPEIARQIAPLFEPQITSQALTDEYYDQKKDSPKSTATILRELSTGNDTWLRAVSVMALGELAADNNNLRRIILDDETIPRAKTGQLSPCQKHIDPNITAVTLRSALASKNDDVQRAARAALRLVRGETVFDSIAQAGDKENLKVLSTIERMIYLKRVAIFQTLSVEQLKALATICDEKVFKKGEQVFKQGDAGGSLYIVISGRVEVGLMSAEKDTFTRLADYEANTEFGEMSLFDGQPRSADAVASEDTLMLTIRREPLLALTRQYPDLSVHLITTLSERLRHANEQIARLNSTMSETIDV